MANATRDKRELATVEVTVNMRAGYGPIQTFTTTLRGAGKIDEEKGNPRAVYQGVCDSIKEAIRGREFEVN